MEVRVLSCAPCPFARPVRMARPHGPSAWPVRPRPGPPTGAWHPDVGHDPPATTTRASCDHAILRLATRPSSRGPSPRAPWASVAQLARASDFGSEGCRFEPCRAHHAINHLRQLNFLRASFFGHMWCQNVPPGKLLRSRATAGTQTKELPNIPGFNAHSGDCREGVEAAESRRRWESVPRTNAASRFGSICREGAAVTCSTFLADTVGWPDTSRRSMPGTGPFGSGRRSTMTPASSSRSIRNTPWMRATEKYRVPT